MHISKKIVVTLCLLSGVILLASMTLIQQKEEPKLVNLKVFPKSITHKQLEHVMQDWANSLGVKCGFCHARNEETKKTDFPSDAKPEKTMARHMFLMMNKINKKYFKAKKDSLGMMAESGINCNTCHRGNAHPELSILVGKTRVSVRKHDMDGAPAMGQPGQGPGNGAPGTPPPSGDKKPQ